MKPKPKINIRAKLAKALKKFRGNKKAQEELFKIFGKRYGKFKELGTAKTKEEAKKKFLKFQVGTLGRSAFIEKGGKKLSIKELGLNQRFRPSKELRGVIVQKKTNALGTFGERKEIIGSRKRITPKWI